MCLSQMPAAAPKIMFLCHDIREILIAAKPIAIKPKILEVLKTLLEFPDKPAIIAPTIITDEIAFVTDINGVCKDGVTLQTT